jgi:hypothetical protein
MNQKLQNILEIIQQSEKLDAEQKETLVKAVKDVDKELEITMFKLERTEKVKKSTAILLEETIEELEQKRKAIEEQNRELEIEAALERVRTRSMGMHKSNELKDVVRLLYKEFRILVTDIHSVNIQLNMDSSKDIHFWASIEEDIYPELYHLPYTDLPIFEKFYNAFNSHGGVFFDHLLNKEEKDAFFNEVFKIQPVPPQRKKMIQNAEGMVMMGWFHKHSGIDILRYNLKRFNEEEKEIVKRFAAAFEQTYIRFLDLQKAEAQAREAEIQLALERVRAKTMAMHKSEELQEIIEEVFRQLKCLDLTFDNAIIGLPTKDLSTEPVWMATKNFELAQSFFIPFDKIDNPIINNTRTLLKTGQEFYHSKAYPAEEAQKYYFDMLNKTILHKIVPEEHKKFLLNLPQLSVSIAGTKTSYLLIHSYSGNVLSSAQAEVLQRFARVFEQTYTRFLDLQKAEAQAREVEIQLALERVRSRSIAMHHSDELPDVLYVLFEQFHILGIKPSFTHFSLFDDENDTFTILITAFEGQRVLAKQVIDINEMKVWQDAYRQWKEEEEDAISCIDYPPEVLPEVFKIMEPIFNELRAGSEMKIENFPNGIYTTQASCKFGYLGFNHTRRATEEEKEIVVRFAKEFGRSYQRFLDLQKAEAQAREAQIAAALERVRSRTMAMQKSGELTETASVVFKQLINLGIEPNRIYIGIIKDEKGNCEFWITDENGSKVDFGFMTNLNDNQSFKILYKGWQQKEKSITIDMQGEELQEYLNHMTKIGVPFKGGLTQKRRLQYIAYFSKGFFGVASPDETKQETIELLERFAAVFNLTYTRYSDLLQVEAHNKIIQAENERKSRELEEARELQLAMLPKQIPEHPKLDIKVFMQTATEVGGDYYDFSYRDDGSFNIAIGDATGHGMKAGTLVTMMKSLFTANSSSKNIEDFFASSNAAIKNSNLKRMMAAFAMLNISDHKAKFINAAMPPLYHFRKNEAKTVEVKHHRLPLGAMSIEKYNSLEIKLSKGDVLIMMTDGFPELHNPIDELMGYERTLSYIEKAVDKEPNEIIEYLREQGDKWSGNKERIDDVTFVVVKVK